MDKIKNSQVIFFTADHLIGDRKTTPFTDVLANFSQRFQKIYVFSPQFQPRARAPRLGVYRYTRNVIIIPHRGLKILLPFFLFFMVKRITHPRVKSVLICHDHGMQLNGIAAIACKKKFHLPLISELHGLPGRSTFGDRLRALLHALYFKMGHKNFEFIRVVNQSVLPQALARWSVPTKKVKYLSSIYNLPPIEPLAGHSRPYDFIWIGRVEKNKGIWQLLEACHELQLTKRVPLPRLLIVGSGQELRAAKQYCAKKNLQPPEVTFTGAIDRSEVFHYLKLSYFHIITSFHEGGPRTLFEALAAATPVIATPVGLVPDFITDGQTGYILPDHTPQAILARIEQLQLLPEHYQKMQQMCQARIEKIDGQQNLIAYRESIAQLFDATKK